MLLCALGVHAQDAPASTCAVTVEIRDFDDYYPSMKAHFEDQET